MANVSFDLMKPFLKVGAAGNAGFSSVMAASLNSKIEFGKLLAAMQEFANAAIANVQSQETWGDILGGYIRKDATGALLVSDNWIGDIVKAWNENHATDQIEIVQPKVAAPAVPVVTPTKPATAKPTKPPVKKEAKGDPKSSAPKVELEKLLLNKEEPTTGSKTRGVLYDYHRITWPESEQVAKAIFEKLGKVAAGDYVYRVEKVIHFSKDGVLLATSVMQAINEPQKEGAIKQSLSALLPNLKTTDLESIIADSRTAIQAARVAGPLVW